VRQGTKIFLQDKEDGSKMKVIETAINDPEVFNPEVFRTDYFLYKNCNNSVQSETPDVNLTSNTNLNRMMNLRHQKAQLPPKPIKKTDKNYDEYLFDSCAMPHV
jgi:hypothetical protein